MKTKNTILYILIITLVVVILFQSQCNNPEPIFKDNKELLDRIDVLVPQYDSLALLAGNLSVQLEIEKNKKDSIVYKLKPHYITVHDTVLGKDIDCLPKPHVDNLISTYEDLLEKQDTLISVKDKQIVNLETQNTTKDTIIDNFKENEIFYEETIKKEKGKKWTWGGAGAILGYVLGKIF